MRRVSIPWYRRTSTRLVVSVILLLICLQLVNWREMIHTLGAIDFWLFVGAFLLNMMGTVLIRAWIAHMTTQVSGLDLGFIELVRINLVARFYTIALPRGVSAAIRWHQYRKGGDGNAAAALLLFENLVSVLTLFFSAALMLLIESHAEGGVAGILLPVCWSGTVAVALVLIPFLYAPSAVFVRRLLQPLLRSPGWFSGKLEMLLIAVESYHDLPRRKVGAVFLAGVLGYVFFVLSAWVLANGMALGVGLAAIAWVRSVTLLVALVPITVAGIGLRETMLIALLREYGVSSSAAFAYAIASFSIQLLLGAMGAILEAWRISCGRGRVSLGKSEGGMP